MKITLLTRDGGFVRDGEIPPFTPPPEVITWGSRVFVRGVTNLSLTGPMVVPEHPYTEGMLYPLEAADALNRRLGHAG